MKSVQKTVIQRIMAQKTNAARLLDRMGIHYELREYDVDPDDLAAETVAAKIGLPPEQVFKTLVARGDRSGIVMAVIPGNEELNLKALATAAGERKIQLVPVKELQALTGYIRGGVTALAAKRDFPVYVDETMELFDVVSISAGVRGLQILIAPGDYLSDQRNDRRAGAGEEARIYVSSEKVKPGAAPPKSGAASGWNNLSRSPCWGEVANAVGNGQSEDYRFHGQAIKRNRFRAVQSGMRQQDEDHKQLDPDAEIQAADKRILREEWEFAAGQVVNRRPNASDEEVQDHAKDPGTGSAVDGRLPAEQPSGNVEGNIPAVLDADPENVHSPANERTHDNRQNNVLFHGWTFGC